tara:strand:- start:199 stop:768 length:570 start_codon:yes stop_codon:yes gene_type:complete
MFLYSIIITFLSFLLSDSYYQDVIKVATNYGCEEKALKDSIYYEASKLTSIGTDIYGRNQFLNPDAANAFYDMKQAALKAGIELNFISAYRSFEYQKKIIDRKLESGHSIEFILNENKLPGFSEHHTGNAIDFISNYNQYQLNEDFEDSIEFKWLEKNASQFGFYLSYPKNNIKGIKYEPWHWSYLENH